MNPELHKSTDQLVRQMIYPFYLIERDMRLPIREQDENDAEHSWSLALAACALASTLDPSLDLGKVAQFAIVHDLVEVYSGDISVWDKADANHNAKEDNEQQALQKIKEEYAHLPWIAATIEEYESKKSNEANYVWAMDKYVAMYMRYDYAEPFFKGHHITKADFDKGIARMYPKTHAHKQVGELFDDLIIEFDAHPEWFAEESAA